MVNAGEILFRRLHRAARTSRLGLELGICLFLIHVGLEEEEPSDGFDLPCAIF